LKNREDAITNPSGGNKACFEGGNHHRIDSRSCCDAGIRRRTFPRSVRDRLGKLKTGGGKCSDLGCGVLENCAKLSTNLADRLER
jgi:hypothetical protein